MRSPCTGPRLVRSRVRDLASCFYACRLPLEEEPDIFCSISPEMSSRSIAFDSKGVGRGHDAGAKMSIAKKMSEENGAQSVQSSSYNIQNGGQVEPHFAKEDYIVFCFREDGAIQMINEGKSSEAFDYDDNDEIKEFSQQYLSKMDCFESCDSNLSDTSTSSFAFPVLAIEWIGSPVYMPKSRERDGQTRHLHCCRF